MPLSQGLRGRSLPKLAGPSRFMHQRPAQVWTYPRGFFDLAPVEVRILFWGIVVVFVGTVSARVFCALFVAFWKFSEDKRGDR